MEDTHSAQSTEGTNSVVAEKCDGVASNSLDIVASTSAEAFSEIRIPEVTDSEVQHSHPGFLPGQVTLNDDFLTEDDLNFQFRCPLNRDSESDSSSDVDFEITIRGCGRMSLCDADGIVCPRPSGRTFDDEYYKLPPLENLVIDDKPHVLEPMGEIDNVIDFVVTIKSLPRIKPFDYDTVLFTEENLPFGSIFEVYGPVTEPMYAIRFNTAEEASAYPIGTTLYYAPHHPALTKTVQPSHLAQARIYDKLSEDESEYSDDEAEATQQRKKVAKNRNQNRDLPGHYQPSAKRQNLSQPPRYPPFPPSFHQVQNPPRGMPAAPDFMYPYPPPYPDVHPFNQVRKP